VRCAGKPADVAVDQIRTISTLRLTRKIAVLSAEKATRLRELIVEMYGLP
jgi:mRNA-degrading endonuclease toxin of MazEF toxin-antitoxin module